MPFEFEPLEIEGLRLVRPRRFDDARGYFLELHKRSDFRRNGIAEDFVQDNYSHSVKGAVRGLHYQKDPYAQGKLVAVIRGEVFDVAVDMRVGSPTFGKWASTILTGESHTMLYVPPGFAHGFAVLSEEADVIYKATAEYHPESEAGVIWNDSQLAINWPVNNPTVSQKDASLPSFREAGNNFRVTRAKQ